MDLNVTNMWKNVLIIIADILYFDIGNIIFTTVIQSALTNQRTYNSVEIIQLLELNTKR